MAKHENTQNSRIVNRGGTNTYTNTVYGAGAKIVDGKVVKGDKAPDTKDKKK